MPETSEEQEMVNVVLEMFTREHYHECNQLKTCDKLLTYRSPNGRLQKAVNNIITLVY